jgi:trimethylamine monooxygenase
LVYIHNAGDLHLIVCLEGRANKISLIGSLRLEHAVKWVQFDQATNLFHVLVHGIKTNLYFQDTFSHIVIASGNCSTQTFTINGIQTFTGNIITSYCSNMIDYSNIHGKNVLVLATELGKGNEEINILYKCFENGSRSISLTTIDGDMINIKSIKRLHSNTFDIKPKLESISGSIVTFSDYSSNYFDVIIIVIKVNRQIISYLDANLFPFINSSNEKLYPANLYKGVFSCFNNNLMFIGMLRQVYI